MEAWGEAWGEANEYFRILLERAWRWDRNRSLEAWERWDIHSLSGYLAYTIIGAIMALMVSGLQDEHGATLSQEYVETLLAPWISVMGDPRLEPGGVA
jgi:hypothetical protein